ncbi:MAG: DUF3786 domain-containing protein [Chloroflexi bacterium]|nr:DUF3786 domain-containing protein [Chloroflexota bacterium]
MMAEETRWLLGETPNPLGDRADEMRAELRGREPFDLANRTGTIYTPRGDSGGEFKLVFWDREVLISFPDFTAKDAQTEEQLNTFDQTMLLYYFHLSDGTPQAGKWIAFSELPDGKFYAQAYQGYTGQELSRTFGNDSEAFIQAAESLDGLREFFGNIAYSYQVLPRLAIMVVCWLGDEDFPASYRILFDASIGHHLTTDACAIVGSTLARKLIKAKGS